MLCVCAGDGHAPLGSSLTARCLPGWWHRTKPLPGGRERVWAGEGSGCSQHQGKADSRAGRGGSWGPPGIAKQARAGEAQAWPVPEDAVGEHPWVAIIPASP